MCLCARVRREGKNIDRILDASHKVSVIKIKYSGLNKRKGNEIQDPQLRSERNKKRARRSRKRTKPRMSNEHETLEKSRWYVGGLFAGTLYTYVWCMNMSTIDGY